MEIVQILELFGGIGAPRCALKRLNIPTNGSNNSGKYTAIAV